MDVYGLVNSHSLSSISHLKSLFGLFDDISNSSKKSKTTTKPITEQSEEQKLEKFDFQKKIALKPESKIVKHT